MIRPEIGEGCDPGQAKSTSHGTANNRCRCRDGHPCGSGVDSDGGSSSLLPIWKDDGDDGSSIHSGSSKSNTNSNTNSKSGRNGFPGIPSMLEFTVVVGAESESVSDRDEDGDEHHLLAPISPSSSTGCRSELAGDDFPFDFYIDPTDQSSDKDELGINDIAEEVVASAERLNSFRRRLHSSMDTGNASLSESQSSSQAQSPALPLLSYSSSAPRSRLLRRTSPRFLMMLAAMTLVFLSVHDSIQSSRRYYREQYQLLSSDRNDRREEVAFPIVQVQVQVQVTSDAKATTTRTTYKHSRQGTETETSPDGSPAELPKFYLPRFESPQQQQQQQQQHSNSNSNTNSNNFNSVRGSKTHNNLAMARAKEHPRPVFVPDVPLPGGGFRKPLERFVFDENRWGEQPPHRERHVLGVPDSFLPPSWFSRIVGLFLVAKLVESGWRERRKCRTGGRSSVSRRMNAL
eukprot:jgi/Psemu1/23065/gm1.23065_g